MNNKVRAKMHAGSPLAGMTTGGHLDVVKLLVDHGSDLDSQDNRKVSCLMATFRKVHS